MMTSRDLCKLCLVLFLFLGGARAIPIAYDADEATVKAALAGETVTPWSKPANILMVGDSTMKKQYELLLEALNDDTSKNVTPFLYENAGQKWDNYPSAHTADRVLREIAAPKSRVKSPFDLRGPPRFDVVYLNFGAVHLLHLSPQRNFWRNEYTLKKKPGCKVDFDGYLYFEEWIEAEIMAYRTVATSVVLMTPNWICADKFSGAYAHLAGEGSQESIEKCVYGFRSSEWPWPLVPRDAAAACASGRFTGNGTESLAKRLRNVAARLGAPVVDATAQTKGLCNSTKDGKHYNSDVVAAQLEELRRVSGYAK